MTPIDRINQPVQKHSVKSLQTFRAFADYVADLRWNAQKQPLSINQIGQLLDDYAGILTKQALLEHKEKLNINIYATIISTFNNEKTDKEKLYDLIINKTRQYPSAFMKNRTLITKAICDMSDSANFQLSSARSLYYLYCKINQAGFCGNKNTHSYYISQALSTSLLILEPEDKMVLANQIYRDITHTREVYKSLNLIKKILDWLMTNSMLTNKPLCPGTPFPADNPQAYILSCALNSLITIASASGALSAGNSGSLALTVARIHNKNIKMINNLDNLTYLKEILCTLMPEVKDEKKVREIINKISSTPEESYDLYDKYQVLIFDEKHGFSSKQDHWINRTMNNLRPNQKEVAVKYISYRQTSSDSLNGFENSYRNPIGVTLALDSAKPDDVSLGQIYGLAPEYSRYPEEPLYAQDISLFLEFLSHEISHRIYQTFYNTEKQKFMEIIFNKNSQLIDFTLVSQNPDAFARDYDMKNTNAIYAPDVKEYYAMTFESFVEDTNKHLKLTKNKISKGNNSLLGVTLFIIDYLISRYGYIPFFVTDLKDQKITKKMDLEDIYKYFGIDAEKAGKIKRGEM